MKKLLLLTVVAPTIAAAATTEQPNIIVILSDDMGYSDIGCYGSEIKTPNLDRLAKSGVRFTQFYNGARSCPSRASLMTGLYPHQAGLGSMTVKPKRVSEGYTGSINTFVSYKINWANVSNTPFRLYKKNSHEGGIATPLIVHWSDGLKARNKIVDEPSHLIDIMATCIDVSGAQYPTTYDGGEIRPMEGRSLIPICEGEAVEVRPLFFAHGGKNGVRWGDWKIACEQNKPWELYHISEDRAELNNLASKYPERVEELKKMWNEWAVRAHVK